MADVKISDLPAAGAAQDADVTAGVQSGTTVKQSNSALATYMATKLAATGSFLLSANNLSDVSNAGTARSNLGITLQNAYNLSSFPQITGDLVCDAGDGTQCIISGSQLELKSTNDEGVDNIFSDIEFSGQTPSGNIVSSQFESGFCKESSGNSGFLNLVVLDNNAQNRIFYAKGTSSTSGARIGLGNSGLTGNVSNVSINLGYGDTPNPNAIFQINSTTQGLQPPQMTTAQMNAIPVTPSDAGLTIYVIDGIEGEYICNGVGWDLTNGGGTSGDLQAAYDAGNTIALTTGLPVQISTQGAAINFVTYSDSTTSNGSDTLKGEQFTSSQNGFVTALQYADRHFTSGARQVGLYRSSDQVLLASALVDKSDPLDGTGNYRTHAITPVAITAGVNYFVVCIVPAGEQWVFYAWSAPSPLTYTALTYQETTSTLSYPTMIISTPNLLYYGNQALQFTPLSSSASFNDSTQPALFSITSTTQGSLPWPLQSTSQFAALSLTKGLVAFDNVLNRPTVYDGSTIQTLAYKSDTPSVLSPSAGGTGVSNSSNLTWTGGNNLTFTTSAATNVTLPTSGTLVNNAVTTLSSLSSIGTISTGVWNGSVVGSQWGGTGVNNGSNTITLNSANFVLSGGNNLTLTTTGITNVTLPPSGTLVASGSSVTFNGIQDTALVGGPKGVFADASGNLTFTGTLPVTQGGTGTAIAFTPNSVVFAATGGGYAQDNANFSYNSSTHTLSVTNATISGTLSGTATNATNVATTQVSSNASYFLTMVASSTNSNQAIDVATGLSYNPSTNIIGTTGLTLSGLTLGSVPFVGSSGAISQDNSNLFWDNTNKNLYLGTNSGTNAPSITTSLVAFSSTQAKVRIALTGQEFFQASNSSANGIGLAIGVNRSNNRQLYIMDTARSAVSSTNAVVRVLLENISNNYVQIDGCATDGSTQIPIVLGNGSTTILAGSNIGICGSGGGVTTPSFGGGSGVIFIQNDGTDPTVNPSGGGILYVSSGALKYRGSSGTVTVLGNA